MGINENTKRAYWQSIRGVCILAVVLIHSLTPLYLVYLYTWNCIVGTSPRLYETLFPAWFGFYYLGI